MAAVLILASHYLEDSIYHWDAGTGMGKGLKSSRTALSHELVDLLLTAAVVLTFFPLPHVENILEIARAPQVWGGLLALLPDLLEAPRNFLHYEPAWLKPLSRFHKSFHRSTPAILAGLAPQVLLLLLIYLLK